MDYEGISGEKKQQEYIGRIFSYLGTSEIHVSNYDCLM